MKIKNNGEETVGLQPMKAMNIKPIDLADFELVRIKTANNCNPTPHCKKHGAMNKVSLYANGGGIWRCITTVAKDSDNCCRAGCEEVRHPVNALIV